MQVLESHPGERQIALEIRRQIPLKITDSEEWAEVADVKTFREAVALFEKVGMPARNLAGETRRAYVRDLQGLADFLEERNVERMADVSLRDLEAYLPKLDSEGYAPSTRRRQSHTLTA